MAASTKNPGTGEASEPQIITKALSEEPTSKTKEETVPKNKSCNVNNLAAIWGNVSCP